MVSKGQLSTIDSIFGTIGLILIILIGFILFPLIYSGVSLFLEEKNIELKSFYAIEQLLSSGSPSNWNFLSLDKVNNFGIEEQSGVLDVNKIIAFNSSVVNNYSFVTNLLGLSLYNFSIVISDYYTNIPIYSIGLVNSTNSLSLQRVSSINNSLVIVRMRVSK